MWKAWSPTFLRSQTIPTTGDFSRMTKFYSGDAAREKPTVFSALSSFERAEVLHGEKLRRKVRHVVQSADGHGGVLTPGIHHVPVAELECVAGIAEVHCHAPGG